MPLKSFIKEVGVVASTTFGAGVFALPYIFAASGWLAGLFYLALLSLVVILVHFIYFRVLERDKEKNRLLGLVRANFGKRGFALGIFVILAGLMLTLVVYLILGGQFLKILFPSFSPFAAAAIFWFVAVVSLFAKERRSISLEAWGIVLMAAAIVFIFFSSRPEGAFARLAPVDLKNFFLPFGAIFLALAGWTAIEPVYDIEEKSKKGLAVFGQPYLAIVCGTVLTALFYVMFVLGILGSVPAVTPDTISALAGWPRFKLAIVAVLGLFALWTSYLPIGLEIKNSLESDLNWKPRQGVLVAAVLPLFLFFSGINNFLKVIGLVGGVFVGLQYLLIVLVGKKILRPRGVKKFLYNLVSAIFVLTAIYEIYYFIVK